MSVTVHDIYQMIQEIAPFETAEAFDNVGLIIGRGDREVNRILIALDVTMDVVKEENRKLRNEKKIINL